MGRTKFLFLVVVIILLASTSLQARVSHGHSSIFSIDTITAVGDEAGNPPQPTRLATNYPNPFNPRTTIVFDLADAGPVELAIFDVSGRLVRVVVSSSMPSGRHRKTWDGQNRGGHAAPAGTYFCRLVTHDGSQTKKMTLIR